jgi:hypothetical protein
VSVVAAAAPCSRSPPPTIPCRTGARVRSCCPRTSTASTSAARTRSSPTTSPLFRLDFGGSVGIGLGLQVRHGAAPLELRARAGLWPRAAPRRARLRPPHRGASSSSPPRRASRCRAPATSPATSRPRAHEAPRWDASFAARRGGLRVAGRAGRTYGRSLWPSVEGRVVLTPTAPLSVGGGARLRLITLHRGRDVGRPDLRRRLPGPSRRGSGALAAEVARATSRPPRCGSRGATLEPPRFGHAWIGGLVFSCVCTSTGRPPRATRTRGPTTTSWAVGVPAPGPDLRATGP